MEKILVSACLLGKPVRYDGKANLVTHSIWQQWTQQGRLIAICPECAGGLSTPRPAAEQKANGRVQTYDGQDVTEAFELGAEQAVALAQAHQIKLAILKAKSPSCGNEQIYDGSFERRLVAGHGIAAKRLSESGVRLFNEHQIEQALAYLDQLEADRTA